MKKIVVFLVVTICSCILYSCAQTPIVMNSYEIDDLEVNNYPDASMVISEESITNKGLTLELYYYGEDQGMTGTSYSLYAYNNDDWNELAYIINEDVVWDTSSYRVFKNHANEMTIDWEWLYGELLPGRYLIAKNFMNFRESSDYDNYLLACEFILA